MNINEFIKTKVKPEDGVLDIGCGDKRRSADLVCKRVVTLDAWEETKPDILLNLETDDLPFQEDSFDIVLLIDFVEHLDKKRGRIIMEQAKKIVRKKIILLTPLWWTDNAENVNNPDLWCYNNKFDYHKSLWKLDDFFGWDRITGLAGLNDYFVGVYNKGDNNV